jgi:hypothetical protein
VALAHILAAENPNAEGRYICHTTSLSMMGISKSLAKYFPELPIPKWGKYFTKSNGKY